MTRPDEDPQAIEQRHQDEKARKHLDANRIGWWPLAVFIAIVIAWGGLS